MHSPRESTKDLRHSMRKAWRGFEPRDRPQFSASFVASIGPDFPRTISFGIAAALRGPKLFSTRNVLPRPANSAVYGAGSDRNMPVLRQKIRARHGTRLAEHEAEICVCGAGRGPQRNYVECA